MGEMRIMDQSGDTKLIWDPNIDDELQNAERTFKDLKKKGYSAYRVDKKGEKSGLMEEFDEDAGKIIMVPKMKGG
jgi:hypothetical protein